MKTIEIMDKGFDYARKSSEDKNKQIQSINDQLRELRKFRENRTDLPLVLTEPFTEEKSAKVSGVRNAFYQMLKRIVLGEANCIYTWRADRLARNGSDGGKIIEMVDNGLIKKIVTPSRVMLEELQKLNVPVDSRIKPKTIPRVTTKLNFIEI